MQPVVRMRSVVRAFLNGPSCVYVEPVNRSTYVVPERNGKFFWRLLYVYKCICRYMSKYVCSPLYACPHVELLALDLCTTYTQCVRVHYMAKQYHYLTSCTDTHTHTYAHAHTHTHTVEWYIHVGSVCIYVLCMCICICIQFKVQPLSMKQHYEVISRDQLAEIEILEKVSHNTIDS